MNQCVRNLLILPSVYSLQQKNTPCFRIQMYIPEFLVETDAIIEPTASKSKAVVSVLVPVVTSQGEAK